MKEKIRKILQKMIDDGEFEKIIKYETSQFDTEREEVQRYYDDLKKYGVDGVPIVPLIALMPKHVVGDVLFYLIDEDYNNTEKIG